LTAIRAVIFDLGGTLVDFPERGAQDSLWGASFERLSGTSTEGARVGREAYVRTMEEAEAEHWRRVVEEWWSGPPDSLVRDGFRGMRLEPTDEEIAAALDGYAAAVEGWSVAFLDARETLALLKEGGFRLGLLSNTWWASAWHDAALAAQGLAGLLDAVVYTSDLPRSKPHPSVFLQAASRLGVRPEECVMVGDNMAADVVGGLQSGMLAVWKRNDGPWPRPEGVRPSATVDRLAELPTLIYSSLA
jgi:putative hydrolase of the HAD superfamily